LAKSQKQPAEKSQAITAQAIRDILTSTDAQLITYYLRALLVDKIQEIKNQTPDAAYLFMERFKILDQPNGEEVFKARFVAMDEKNRQAFNRFTLIDALVDQAATRIALLNTPNDREHNPYHLESLMGIVQAAGLGPDYVEQVMSGVWKGHTITPHPTGYLQEVTEGDVASGVDLFMDLIDIGVFHSGYEVPGESRQEELNKALDALLEAETITPSRRATTLEEIKFAASFGLKYVNARSHVLDRVTAASENVFGPRKNAQYPPNFTRRECRMDMALRAWHAGDYDGKPNAEQWTLMAGQVVTTYMAISNHLWRLEQANRYLKGEKPENLGLSFDEAWANQGRPNVDLDDMHHELQDLYELLGGLKTSLYEVFSDIETAMGQITDPTIDGARRAEVFKELEPIFANVKTRMANLYDNRRLKGRTLKSDHGLHVYDSIVREFKRLREVGTSKSHWSDEATTLFEDAAEDLRMDGIALFKIEPRHNHDVNNQIVDNLFNLKSFRAYTIRHGILELDDFRFVDAVGGFRNIDLEDQHRILSAVEAGMPREDGQLLKFFYEANPEGYDDNGYPLQTYGTLRRLEVMEMYQLKFGPMAIIAESDNKGARLQSFIFSPFHLDLMVHTPLNEDHENILGTHLSIEQNYELGAKDRIAKRIRRNVPGQFKRAGGAAMKARSDITRQFGQFSGALIYMQMQRDAEMAARLGKPYYAYEGSGLSNERGGGDPMVAVRLIAQSLQEYQNMTGQPLSEELLSMASSVIHTVQGRELYKTEREIARETESQIAEIIGMRMELEGHVKPGTFIPQKQVLSPTMEKFLRAQINKMMSHYSDVRNAKHPEQGIEVLNLLALIVSDPTMAGNTNNAARMLSKSAGNKAKTITQQRAIGNNIWLALMRTHHDGWFTAGKFMEELHEALHKGFVDEDGQTCRLQESDIEDLLDNEFWDYNAFVRTLTPLARADFAHGAHRLGIDHWGHDQMMSRGRSARVSEDGVLEFAQIDGATAEQSYFAGLYYDAQSMTAGMNALADGSFSSVEDFEIIRRSSDAPNLSLAFNEAAEERWSFLPAVRESARRSRPVLAVMDAYEEQLAAGQKFSTDEQRAAASAYRGTSVTPNQHIVIDYARAYGRRREPLPANPTDVLPTAVHMANDNALSGLALEITGEA